MNSSSSGSRPNGSNTPANNNSNRQNTTSQGNSNRSSGGYNSGNRDSNYRGAGSYSSGGAQRTGGYQQGGYNNRSRSPTNKPGPTAVNQTGTATQSGTGLTASATSSATGTASNSNFNRRPAGQSSYGQSNYGGSGGGYNPNYSRPAGQGNYGGGSYGNRAPGAGGGYQKREYGNRREGPPEAHRINSRITAREVRVVSESGEQLGVLPTHQALEIAQRDGYDLVEVAPQANPPVCKIMDYGKFKYREQKKEAEAKKKRTESTLKELRIRYRTDSGDLETKLKQAREFFEEGDKVKFSMRFKGREAAFIDLGVQKFNQIVERLADIASVDERSPAFGKQIHITFAPLKTATAPKSKKTSNENTIKENHGKEGHDKSAKGLSSDTMAAKLIAATQKNSEDKPAEQKAPDSTIKE